MKRSDEFVRYAEAGLPALLLSADGHVLSRNELALSISGKLRCRSNLLPYLPENIHTVLKECKEQCEVAIIPLLLPQTEQLSALVIPTEFEKQHCFLLLLFRESILADLPPHLSTAVRKTFWKNQHPDYDSENAAEFFTHALRKGFALALTAEDFPQIFSAKHACAFLNRFSEKALQHQLPEINALCTTDCIDLPLYNFPRFTALLICLCLFCIPMCDKDGLKVLFFLEQEQMSVRLTLPADDSLGDAPLPLSLFEAPLHLLGYRASYQKDADGSLHLILTCEKAVPAGSIRTDEDDRTAELFLQILLSHFIGT